MCVCSCILPWATAQVFDGPACLFVLLCLQQNEFVRPGFELGFKDGDKYYIRNHLQFNILVHPTHGEYMRARQGYKDAAVLDNVNARRLLVSRQELLAAGVSEEQLSSMAAGRELQADAAPGGWGCSRGWGHGERAGGPRVTLDGQRSAYRQQTRVIRSVQVYASRAP